MAERTREEMLKALEAHRAKQAERESARQLDKELEELKALEELAAYEEKNGLVGVEYVRVRDRIVILRPPAFQLYRRFLDKKETTSEDARALVRTCVAYPPAADFDAICEQYPAAPMACLEKVAVLAGIAEEKLGKA